MTEPRLPLQLPLAEAVFLYLRRLRVLLTVAIANMIVFGIIVLISLIPWSSIPAPFLFPILILILLTLIFIVYRKMSLSYLESSYRHAGKPALKKLDFEPPAIVSLVWKQRPEDLDLILVVEFKEQFIPIYFGNKGTLREPPWAVFEIDVRNGFGPETITVFRFLPGKYICFVLNYSNEVPIRDSAAEVHFNLVNREYRFRCPQQGTGRWWEVFIFDAERGTVKESGRILEHPPFQIRDWPWLL
jgi:hypothetical protein